MAGESVRGGDIVAGGVSKTFGYDDQGDQTDMSATDGNSADQIVQHTELDDDGNVTQLSQTNSAGTQVQNIGYDDDGNLADVTSMNVAGAQTHYTCYDNGDVWELSIGGHAYTYN